MKLTIITVNRNNLTGLKKTVESVLKQSWREFEYLVIDGASTDGSAEYLESVSKDLTWGISEKDRSLYDAMNKGIERARGEYVLFLNSGDYLADQKVLARVQGELTGEGLIYGNLRFIHPDGKKTLQTFPAHLDFGFLYAYYLPHPGTFIKRELFDTIGQYRVDGISSDWQFFMNAVLEFGVSYIYLNQCISVYDTKGISSHPKNLEIIDREKKNFIVQNFPALSDHLLKTLEEDRGLIRNLRRSRVIRMLLSLGLLKYLKVHLERHR